MQGKLDFVQETDLETVEDFKDGKRLTAYAGLHFWPKNGTRVGEANKFVVKSTDDTPEKNAPDNYDNSTISVLATISWIAECMAALAF